MNKEGLVAIISERGEISKKSANEMVNLFMEAVSSTLENGESISLIGFGSFKVVDRAPREARHPMTGEVIKIPACKAVKFIPGKSLKEKIQIKKKKTKKSKKS
ncbi:MAG: HU family DNA-binding protein [Desulfobacterales bacterium]|nr:HU family DNA-binding protein [Desulfobacterales bacterium]